MIQRTTVRGGLLLATLLIAACGSSAPSATAPVTPVPIIASASTAAPGAMPRPTPSPTAAPTATPTPTATPAPTIEPPASPSLPSGTTGKVTLSDYGFSMVLPKGWQTIGLTPEDVQAIFDALPAGTLPAGLEEQVPALVAAGLKAWAFDVRPTGHGSNVSVIAIGYSIPVALLKPTAQAGLASVKGISNIRMTNIRVDGVKALRVDAKIAMTIQGTKVVATEVQLYIPLRASTMIITLTVPRGGSTSDRDRILRSIRFAG